jgi:hypothetical protein
LLADVIKHKGAREVISNNELAAFEGFRFQIGDEVALADGRLTIVTSRALVQWPSGIGRFYNVSLYGPQALSEMELRPVKDGKTWWSR